jgi:hypothetical protein
MYTTNLVIGRNKAQNRVSDDKKFSSLKYVNISMRENSSQKAIYVK